MSDDNTEYLDTATPRAARLAHNLVRKSVSHIIPRKKTNRKRQSNVLTNTPTTPVQLDPNPTDPALPDPAPLGAAGGSQSYDDQSETEDELDMAEFQQELDDLRRRAEEAERVAQAAEDARQQQADATRRAEAELLQLRQVADTVQDERRRQLVRIADLERETATNQQLVQDQQQQQQAAQDARDALQRQLQES